MNQKNHHDDGAAGGSGSTNTVDDTGPSSFEDRQPDALPDMDWENRVLCRDENCIGVIGPDGRCKECGLAYDGDTSNDQAASAVELTSEGGSEPAEAPPPAERSDIDTDWENRVLCRDENCIGVIGPDGRCKECGKPYDETA